MNIKKIKDKEGKVITTQDGIELVENKLELGDTFIPSHNKIYVDDKGKFPRYKLVCKVLDIKGKEHNDIFVTLTKGQKAIFDKRVEEGVEPNQELWITEEYKTSFGTHIGINVKGKSNIKKGKSFSDFK